MSTDTMTSSSSSSSSSVAKQFACTGCDLSFDRLEHLERHSRIHTGERPFACPFKGCDKHFSRRDNMSQHYRCHLHKGYRNQPREKREVLRKQFQTQGSAAALLLSVAEGNRGSGPSLLGGFISLSSSSSPSSSTSPSSSSSPSSPSSPPFSSRRLSRRRPPHLQTGAAESSASASSLSPSSSSSSPSPSLSPSSSMEHLPLTPRSGSSSCIGSPFHLGSEVIPSPPTTSSSAAPSTSSSGLFLGNESLPPILSLPAPVANQNMLVMSRIDTGMIGLLNQRLRIF